MTMGNRLVDFGNLAREADFLKRTLRRFGLATDFGKAIAMMGGMVRDHRHFETLLTEAGPEIRQELYDSLRPSLKFTAKPLDVYVSDAKQRAEKEQLPVLGPEGQLLPFKPARDASSAFKDAENAIAASLAKRTLTLTCSKCTRQESFYAVGEETPVAVIMKARQAGWIYDYMAETPVEICPDCPTSLRPDA